jgi:hydrogenase expression/formation protein HypE
VPRREADRIQLAHGGGGTLMHRLVSEVFVRAFSNPALDLQHDGALLDVPAARLAFTTDGFVVQPLFFPGGDLGSLAVHGTVNDLAMCGARPLALAAGFILEEGLPVEDLRRLVASMRDAAAGVPVPIVTGDTKVVGRGKGDGVFAHVAGIGVVAPGVDVSPRRVRAGDAVLVSGPVGDHGVAVLSVREGLKFETDLVSDSAPLWRPVCRLLDAVGVGVHALRDATRGGLAGVLCELAGQSGTGIEIEETRVPVRPAVRGACELLGLDPLHVASEGTFVAVVAAERVDGALEALRGDPSCRAAERIGRIVGDHPGRVHALSPVGGTRIVEMPTGEQLPRIC